MTQEYDFIYKIKNSKKCGVICVIQRSADDYLTNPSTPMTIKTLVAGYESPELATLKGAQLKRHQYFQETLASYNFGEVLFLSLEDAKQKINDINPLLVFTFYDTEARELKEIKQDYLLYVIPTHGQIFARKAEIDEQKEKLNKILSEAESVIAEVISGEKEDTDLRMFTALSYKDMYDMITKAIISDDEDLKAKAWDLLWGEGEKHSDIIWMRVQVMAETWEHSKGNQLEQLMLMSMERHLDMKLAREMDTFTDADGQQYHQYMFLDPYGRDMNHIRRLPFAKKDEDRYAYEARLEECEIPTNFLRLQMEANQFRKECDEYLQGECDKIQAVLDKHTENPRLSKKELGVAAKTDEEASEPLSDEEYKIINKMQSDIASLIFADN